MYLKYSRTRFKVEGTLEVTELRLLQQYKLYEKRICCLKPLHTYDNSFLSVNMKSCCSTFLICNTDILGTYEYFLLENLE